MTPNLTPRGASRLIDVPGNEDQSTSGARLSGRRRTDEDEKARKGVTVVETLPRTRVGSPTGPIKTIAPWGRTFGIDWEQINRWDAAIRAASTELNVPFERIKAHIVIESQGIPTAIQKNDQNGWSFGLMQVVPRWWGAVILRLANRVDDNLDERQIGQFLIDDPALAVRAGTAVLRSFFDDVRDWDRASSKFFLGNPDWIGADTVNGNTGRQYRAALQGLIAELTTAPDDDEGEEPPARLSRVQLPPGVTRANLRKWFGDQFDPDGEVTCLWAEEGARTGRFPRLEWFDPPGTVRDFEFDGGLKIRVDPHGVRVLRLAP